ncbi:MAG: PD40 domain-containing protein [Ignavibacteriales bacterium]|nr:PD40 domain-containing protein [Ignavibacteriales bacterium]
MKIQFKIFPKFFVLCFALVFSALAQVHQQDSLRNPDEKHLRNIRQLTFGGTNAEAYFSFGETKLIFQSTRPPYHCDQILTMNLDGSDQKLVSTGTGRTTCPYFFPGDQKILFASTHAASDLCPPSPDKSKGYVWGVFNAYDIYTANADGSNLKVLAASKGYDAEATIAPNGKKIVFTSSRNGDLDLFTMNLDGSDIKQITNDIGYDGGPNFSWDAKRVVYRGYHPKEDSAVAEYKSLLAEQLVKPSKMEIFLCDADGKNKRQLTTTGTASFAPFFHPDNKRIIFSSNMKDPRGRNFELYLIKDDGTALEQVTFGGHFNSFPMFTRDGKQIVFVSDRNAKDRYEFNVFIADWVE